ncbi:hypothetical protein KCH_65060 [Kitasatospora cheerisanensis KCTC 2395]|uniref:Uncharacterized protein n=1 Tax=Kitasatospora cheerisanensis KCTC 2395 TaxID=1348663 RepID=A0A066YUL9_9ACTN|nr:hypothetical protein KCH_65060 [Kitasatospora cheerisanensis KCTC 2395]
MPAHREVAVMSDVGCSENRAAEATVEISFDWAARDRSRPAHPEK